ncbi:Guanine nucleotide exchange factor [Ceraceosorus bombacis]|uniref:Guanine nucleotide exchange factor n=1 Tax=Ceraceosorus bombacis TaxID=401625 RepID=A0A0P1BQT4_9BASI|nr:Guanine nucleotide exchange factor [Ceraceosorus bombacis]
MAPPKASHAEEQDDVPTSHLQRPDPESILADDADPDTLLGKESDSEAGGSRRTSTAEPDFADALDTSSAEAPATPEVNGGSKAVNGSGLGAPADIRTPVTATPTQSEFKALALGNKAAGESSKESKTSAGSAELETQVSDLTSQVMSLNSKLVASYEQRSDLEDDLSDAHNRIMAHTTRIAELEKERQEHLAALNTGLLVEKAHVSTEMQKMMERLLEETAQRGKAVDAKEKMQGELDDLSATLFEEANRMVAAERLLRARAEEKSRNMEERLKDTEGIMLEQQKILGDLQRQVESARSEGADGQRGSLPSESRSADANGWSALASEGRLLRAGDLVRTPSQRSVEDGAVRRGSVAPLLHQHWLQIDIVPFRELCAFLQQLRKLRIQLAPFYTYPLPGEGPKTVSATSGQGSGSEARPVSPGPLGMPLGMPVMPVSFSGLGSSGFAGGYSGPTTNSPFVAAGVGRHKDYPSLPANAESLVHIPNQLSLPFIKRSQEEDSDPCLRFDFAPGLNWLSRRQANAAVLEGTLVVEPVFPGGVCPDEEAMRRANAHLPPAACTMCGAGVVNVPLPGGGHTETTTAAGTAANWISAAGTAAQSFGARSSAESPSATSTPTAPRAKSGIFSTLRSMGSSPRPSVSANNSTSGHAHTSSDTSSNLHGDAEQTPDSPNPAVMAGPAVPLPVPTHIFRVNETSTTRYLICPNHCLARLRAACAFWGYLRSLERAVVLEGKLAWDDAPSAMGPAAAIARAGSPAPPIRPDSVKPSPLSTEVASASEPHAAPTMGKAAVIEKLEQAADAEKGAAEAQTEADALLAPSPEAAEGSIQDAKAQSDSTDAHDDDGEDMDAEAESSFADAQSEASSPQVERTELAKDELEAIDAPQAASTKLIAPQQDEAPPTPKATSTSSATLDEAADKMLTTSTSSSAAASPRIAPPPLPRRATNRRPVPVPPATSRRPSTESQVATKGDVFLAAPPALPRRKSSVATPPSPAQPIRSVLPASGGDGLAWEERVWQEVQRLKAEMARARWGLAG